MNISELTDEELSLWIAEKIEPKPTGDPTQCCACGRRVSHDVHSLAWTMIRDFQTDRIVWIPRYSVNNSAMIVMLLDRMLAEGYEVLMMKHKDTYAVYLELGLMNFPTDTAATLGRVVAESFALSNGFSWGDEG